MQVGDQELAVLSYTTVTGSGSNDALPTSDELTGRPSDGSWYFDVRQFSFDRFGVRFAGDHLPGDVWEWFESLDLDEAEEAVVWREMTAVYPEFQDFVARRGTVVRRGFDVRRSPPTLRLHEQREPIW
jgi:hypothetical protein